MQSALPCTQSVDLVPGNYMLRLGVIDQLSKRIGALTAWVTVPAQAEAVVQAPAASPAQPSETRNNLPIRYKTFNSPAPMTSPPIQTCVVAVPFWTGSASLSDAASLHTHKVLQRGFRRGNGCLQARDLFLHFQHRSCICLSLMGFKRFCFTSGSACFAVFVMVCRHRRVCRGGIAGRHE